MNSLTAKLSLRLESFQSSRVRHSLVAKRVRRWDLQPLLECGPLRYFGMPGLDMWRLGNIQATPLAGMNIHEYRTVSYGEAIPRYECVFGLSKSISIPCLAI